MTARRAALVPFVLLSLAASCPARPTTPETRAAANAIRVVDRVQNLQSAAILANQLGALADAPAITIVQFTTTAARLIEQTPYGYATPVKAAYEGMVAALSPAIQSEYALTLASLKALLILILDGPGAPGAAQP